MNETQPLCKSLQPLMWNVPGPSSISLTVRSETRYATSGVSRGSVPPAAPIAQCIHDGVINVRTATMMMTRTVAGGSSQPSKDADARTARLLLGEGVGLLPPAVDEGVGRRLAAPRAGGAREPVAELGQLQRHQVAQANDAGLGEEQLLGRAEVGQVEQQCLVAPLVDIVSRGVDLVGQILAAGRRLRHLEQQPGGEDALPLERLEVVGRHALEILERRHRGGGPSGYSSVASTLSATLPLSAREIGQPSLACSAASAKAAWSASGTRPRTVRWLLITVQPASSLSPVIKAVTSRRSAVKPALNRMFERAIEKHEAWAAASSSSGPDRPLGSSVRADQLTGRSRSCALLFELTVPLPSVRLPCQIAVAERVAAIASSCLRVVV